MKALAGAAVGFAFLISSFGLLPGTASAAQGDCAQPVTDGASPAATDCLFILQVTVAIQTCDPDPCVCTPKGTFPTSATDALICLQIATGLGGSLNCPCQQGNTCESSQAPTCGGTCSPGDVCAPDPLFPSDCECLSPCEAAAAPTCNASCDDVDPGSTCRSVNFTNPGAGGTTDICVCLPPDVTFCVDAGTPDCEGVCAPGGACAEQAGGAGCECVAQQLPPVCAQASAPQCGGTCADGFLCEDVGGTCDCVQFQGQNENCFSADGPQCGGACAFGELCSVDFLGDCECFLSCEVSAAPACGGDCDPGESCVRRTLTLDGKSLDFCECIED